VGAGLSRLGGSVQLPVGYCPHPSNPNSIDAGLYPSPRKYSPPVLLVGYGDVKIGTATELNLLLGNPETFVACTM
jgi:hypothetical protein